MLMDRRSFLQLAAGSALAAAIPTVSLAHEAKHAGFKAVVFDAFPIFDPRPIAALTESLFPGNGSAIMNAWRVRQFEYQWLRALSGRYMDFLQTTRDSLAFAANQLQLEISSAQQDQLMAAWSNLQVWPDASDTIKVLHQAGLRLAFLSNMTSKMLTDGLKNAKLGSMFEAVLSTDQIQSYKPAPQAYQMGIDTLQLRREEILFVAFAGWDVAGAKWFGYPTFWVNRMGSPKEELGVEADGSGKDLSALINFVLPDNSQVNRSNER